MSLGHLELSIASSVVCSSVAAFPIQNLLQISLKILPPTHRHDELQSVFPLMHADGPSLSKGGVRLGPRVGA